MGEPLLSPRLLLLTRWPSLFPRAVVDVIGVLDVFVAVVLGGGGLRGRVSMWGLSVCKGVD